MEIRYHSMDSRNMSLGADDDVGLRLRGHTPVEMHIVPLGPHVDARDVEVVLKRTQRGTDAIGQDPITHVRVGVMTADPIAHTCKKPDLVTELPRDRSSQLPRKTPADRGLCDRSPGAPGSPSPLHRRQSSGSCLHFRSEPAHASGWTFEPRSTFTTCVVARRCHSRRTVPAQGWTERASSGPT